jgi:hypothetical protein
MNAILSEQTSQHHHQQHQHRLSNPNWNISSSGIGRTVRHHSLEMVEGSLDLLPPASFSQVLLTPSSLMQTHSNTVVGVSQANEVPTMVMMPALVAVADTSNSSQHAALYTLQPTAVQLTGTMSHFTTLNGAVTFANRVLPLAIVGDSKLVFGDMDQLVVCDSTSVDQEPGLSTTTDTSEEGPATGVTIVASH